MPAGVTVRRAGEAQAKPDTLEVQVVISGSGQITGDALVKFRDSARRGQEAYENMKMDGLTVQAGPVVFRSGSAAANANMFAEPWGFRTAYQAAMREFVDGAQKKLRNQGVDYLLLRTDQDLGGAPSHFLHVRERKAGRANGHSSLNRRG